MQIITKMTITIVIMIVIGILSYSILFRFMYFVDSFERIMDNVETES